MLESILSFKDFIKNPLRSINKLFRYVIPYSKVPKLAYGERKAENIRKYGSSIIKLIDKKLTKEFNSIVKEYGEESALRIINYNGFIFEIDKLTVCIAGTFYNGWGTTKKIPGLNAMKLNLIAMQIPHIKSKNDISSIIKKIKAGLMHELTHNRELSSTHVPGKFYRDKDKHFYVNADTEVNAFYNQTITKFEEVLKKSPKLTKKYLSQNYNEFHDILTDTDISIKSKLTKRIAELENKLDSTKDLTDKEYDALSDELDDKIELFNTLIAVTKSLGADYIIYRRLTKENKALTDKRLQLYWKRNLKGKY